MSERSDSRSFAHHLRLIVRAMSERPSAWLIAWCVQPTGRPRRAAAARATPGRLGLTRKPVRWIARPFGSCGVKANTTVIDLGRLHLDGVAAGRSGEVGGVGVVRGEADPGDLGGAQRHRVGEHDRVVEHDAGRDEHEPPPGEAMPAWAEQHRAGDHGDGDQHGSGDPRPGSEQHRAGQQAGRPHDPGRPRRRPHRCRRPQRKACPRRRKRSPGRTTVRTPRRRPPGSRRRPDAPRPARLERLGSCRARRRA